MNNIEYKNVAPGMVKIAPKIEGILTPKRSLELASSLLKNKDIKTVLAVINGREVIINRTNLEKTKRAVYEISTNGRVGDGFNQTIKETTDEMLRR